MCLVTFHFSNLEYIQFHLKQMTYSECDYNGILCCVLNLNTFSNILIFGDSVQIDLNRYTVIQHLHAIYLSNALVGNHPSIEK